MKFNAIRNALNELINKNKDSKDGYHELSMAADDQATREIMEKYAQDRQRFVEVLTNELERLGGKPSKKFNILDDIHRAWIDIKVNNSDNYIKAIHEEIVRGEKIAIEDYQDIIEHVDMPAETHEILLEQLDVIKSRLAMLNK